MSIILRAKMHECEIVVEETINFFIIISIIMITVYIQYMLISFSLHAGVLCRYKGVSEQSQLTPCNVLLLLRYSQDWYTITVNQNVWCHAL